MGEALGLKPFVADLVRNVTWSVFVCAGLAVGTAVVRARAPVMGLLGLVSGPPTSDLFVEGVNEVLFPVGCALVLYSAGVLGKKTASRSLR